MVVESMNRRSYHGRRAPCHWRRPDSAALAADPFDTSLGGLPRTSSAAEDLARGPDARLKRGALVKAAAHVRYRHVFEVRHPSYFHPEFFDLLRRHRIAF